MVSVLANHVFCAEVETVKIGFRIVCRRRRFGIDINAEHPAGIALIDYHKTDFVAEIKLFRTKHSGNAPDGIKA